MFNTFLARNYLNYLIRAETRFDVHSPFLFDLINNVFRDKEYYPEYAAVESLREQLLSNDERIEVTDLGAGSLADNSNLRSIKSITKYSSKPEKYTRLLFRLSHYFKPNEILEFGTAMGISSCSLALGNPSAKITTMEGCPNISRHAENNFKSLGLDRVELITGGFDDVLPSYLENTAQLDMVFIDGNHQEAPTIKYFEQCLNRTVNSSCFIFDDIHWSQGMENAWNTIHNHPAVTLSIDLFQVGIVFFRKELSKQHKVIRF